MKTVVIRECGEFDISSQYILHLMKTVRVCQNKTLLLSVSFLGTDYTDLFYPFFRGIRVIRA